MCDLDLFLLIRSYVQVVMYLGIIIVKRIMYVSSWTVVLWGLIFCYDFYHYFIHCLSMRALTVIYWLYSPHHISQGEHYRHLVVLSCEMLVCSVKKKCCRFYDIVSSTEFRNCINSLPLLYIVSSFNPKAARAKWFDSTIGCRHLSLEN